jgi:hypothetical protein
MNSQLGYLGFIIRRILDPPDAGPAPAGRLTSPPPRGRA